MANNVGQILKEERNAFYQAKYEYYALFMVRMVIIAFCIYVLYFIGDCFVAGGFAYKTVGGRMVILLPFIVYIVLSRKVKDYRVMVFCYISNDTYYYLVYKSAYLYYQGAASGSAGNYDDAFNVCGCRIGFAAED